MEVACRIPFTDAVKGATVKVNLKGGTDVKIPAGEPGLLPLLLVRKAHAVLKRLCHLSLFDILVSVMQMIDSAP